MNVKKQSAERNTKEKHTLTYRNPCPGNVGRAMGAFVSTGGGEGSQAKKNPTIHGQVAVLFNARIFFSLRHNG